ncbi:MAG: sugar nucleotidyltransferase [Alphaproteobacteria bacterium]
MVRKGIVLAGGSGSRLRPATLAVSKQLLPVYDRPMIYYPLALLMEAGIRDILIIAAPDQMPLYRRLLGTGTGFGIRLSYRAQVKPLGLPDAFRVGATFVGREPVCLVLGDNVMFGPSLTKTLARAVRMEDGARILVRRVPDARPFGTVAFDADGRPRRLVEKPAAKKPGDAVPGVYFFGPDVVILARRLKPSARGELEIMDLLRAYLERGALTIDRLPADVSWFDMGVPDSLLDAARAIRDRERKRGDKVACPEAIAWRQGWLGASALRRRADALVGTAYGRYLARCAARRS